MISIKESLLNPKSKEDQNLFRASLRKIRMKMKMMGLTYCSKKSTRRQASEKSERTIADHLHQKMMQKKKRKNLKHLKDRSLYNLSPIRTNLNSWSKNSCRILPEGVFSRKARIVIKSSQALCRISIRFRHKTSWMNFHSIRIYLQMKEHQLKNVRIAIKRIDSASKMKGQAFFGPDSVNYINSP